jgi:NAD(P)-dependent dehydrogenase (short-subunit alcohol dehydrogenase family)
MNNKAKTPNQLFDISGKVAVVTGALGAFGSVAVRSLSLAGCKLVITDDRQDELENFAAELRLEGGEVEVCALWPTSAENCETIVEATVSAYGRLDILVVASGMLDVDYIVDMDVSRFEQVMKTNVTDSWTLCQAAGKQMIEQGSGKVVLMSSSRGLLGLPSGYSAYCSSKHAVNGIVKSLGCEWGKHGVYINALAPTVFRSKLTSWMFEDDENAVTTRNAILSRIPLGRLAEPEDLVGPLLFLVSPASDFHTGHTIYPDGGYTAG